MAEEGYGTASQLCGRALVRLQVSCAELLPARCAVELLRGARSGRGAAEDIYREAVLCWYQLASTTSMWRAAVCDGAGGLKGLNRKRTDSL
jgi:hypothetical protein